MRAGGHGGAARGSADPARACSGAGRCLRAPAGPPRRPPALRAPRAGTYAEEPGVHLGSSASSRPRRALPSRRAPRAPSAVPGVEGGRKAGGARGRGRGQARAAQVLPPPPADWWRAGTRAGAEPMRERGCPGARGGGRACESCSREVLAPAAAADAGISRDLRCPHGRGSLRDRGGAGPGREGAAASALGSHLSAKAPRLLPGTTGIPGRKAGL